MFLLCKLERRGRCMVRPRDEFRPGESLLYATLPGGRTDWRDVAISN